MKGSVKDFMSRSVVTVSERTPFKEIVRLMDRHHVSGLPVVRLDGSIIGIVTEADLLVKEEHVIPLSGHVLEFPRHRAMRRKASGRVASAVMTTPVVTIAPTATLNEAAALMRAKGVKRLPVTDPGGKLVGILSRTDVLRVFLRPDRDIEEEIVRDIVRRTLWIDPLRIEVRVSEGVVRLSGWLDTPTLGRVLVELVHEVDGVVAVEDRLTFEGDETWIPPTVGAGATSRIAFGMGSL